MNSVNDDLSFLGWDDAWASLRPRTDASGVCGRVTRAGRLLTVRTATEELLAHCPEGIAERPVVGDWVVVTTFPDAVDGKCRAILRALLARRNALVRRAPGEGGPRPILANVEAIWIVCDLERPHSLNSVTRFQALASLDGVTLSVLLNKVDRVSDLERCRSIVHEHAPGVEVLGTSAVEGRGIDALESRLRPRSTTALIGPSGVGKSSLINALTRAPTQRTTTVRDSDGRGRHTTSAGELLVTPSGALLIDTPGLREIGIWQSAAFECGFSDVVAIATGCRFRDCRHDGEPDCRVRLALEQGRLSSERFLRYLELERERNASQRRAKSKKRRC